MYEVNSMTKEAELVREYPEIYGNDKCICEDCYSYKGCDDCMFMLDEGCAHNIINDMFRKLVRSKSK